MLVVKIEMHSAITGEVREVGRMYIANDGTQHGSRGSYDAYVCRRGSIEPPREMDPNRDGLAPATRVGRVENYARKSSNVWCLIGKALKACGFVK